MEGCDKSGSENENEDDFRNVSKPDKTLDKLAQDIVEELDIPSDKKEEKTEQVARKLIYATRYFEGPLPPPELFVKYKEVEPSSPDRILRMAELEQSHRHEIETAQVNSQIANDNQENDLLLKQQEFDNRQAQKGLYFAFSIVLIFLFMGFYLIMNNRSTEGYVSISVVIGGIVGNFIYVNKEKKKTNLKINSSDKSEEHKPDQKEK